MGVSRRVVMNENHVRLVFRQVRSTTRSWRKARCRRISRVPDRVEKERGSVRRGRARVGGVVAECPSDG